MYTPITTQCDCMYMHIYVFTYEHVCMCVYLAIIYIHIIHSYNNLSIPLDKSGDKSVHK